VWVASDSGGSYLQRRGAFYRLAGGGSRSEQAFELDWMGGRRRAGVQAARVEAARATDGETGGRGPSRGRAAIARASRQRSWSSGNVYCERKMKMEMKRERERERTKDKGCTGGVQSVSGKGAARLETHLRHAAEEPSTASDRYSAHGSTKVPPDALCPEVPLWIGRPTRLGGAPMQCSAMQTCRMQNAEPVPVLCLCLEPRVVWCLLQASAATLGHVHRPPNPDHRPY
jgi:hypothetical protein